MDSGNRFLVLSKAKVKWKAQGFYRYKMTIATADKLVTSFRFTEENKKKKKEKKV